MQNEKIVGNYYSKYGSKNPVERALMRGFLKSLDVYLDTARPERILDMGCGEGVITGIVREKFPSAFITGAEIDADFLIEHRSGRADSLVINSLPDVCFSGDSFDLVLLLEVLEHVDAPDAALDAVRGITSKYAVISVPHEPVWRMCNMARLKYLPQLGNTPGHIGHYSPSSFKNILSRHFHSVVMATPFPWLMALCEKGS